MTLFADEIRIIAANCNQEVLQTALNKTLSDIISWFKANFPSLNFNKTYLEFRTKNCVDTTLDINYCNISIANDTHIEFLGLVTDGPLAWGNHTDQLISRLNSARYTITAVKTTLSRDALRMLYISYVHSIISYGIIFWGNTPNSVKTFIMHKKVLRTITNLKKMDSCTELFKTMEILSFYSQYIFSLLLHVENNKHLFTKNLAVHNHATRSASHFHLPIPNLTKYKKELIMQKLKFLITFPLTQSVQRMK